MASIIGVETLQHTNGTTAATIDSSGRINTPARPAFKVAKKTTSGSSGASGAVSFNHEFFDIGSNFNTNYFQAPMDGIYSFSFHGFGAGDSSGNKLPNNGIAQVRLEVSTDGGSTYDTNASVYSQTTSTTNYPIVSMNTLVNLDANDRVRIRVSNNYLYFDTTTHYLQFCGHLVG